MSKLISVVIPSFNREFETIRAIESVHTTKPNLVEIIVVDDCSQPGFSHAKLHPNGVEVRVKSTNINSGPGVARAVGVSAANGRLIAFLDSDDIYTKDWIDHVITVYLMGDRGNEPRQMIIVGDVDRATRLHGWARKIVSLPTSNLWRLRLTRLLTLFFNPFYTPTLVISRSLCRFDPTLRHCEDYFTFLEAVYRARELLIEPLIACNLSREPNQRGGLSGARARMFQGELRVRILALQSDAVPLLAKLLVPIGILYQFSREGIKAVGRTSRLFCGKRVGSREKAA